MSDEAPVIGDSPLTSTTPPAGPQPATEPPNPASASAPDADDLAGRLKPEQQIALRHLLAGLSIKEAAAQAGVGRRTLFRWLREDAAFAALFNLWKREQMESARAQALALAGPAMKTIGNAIDKGHVSAALQVARQLGLLQPAKPGPTNPRQLSTQRKLDARRRKLRQQQKDAEIEEQEDKLQKGLDAQTLKYSVMECTDLIKWFRNHREQAILREVEQYNMTPDEIRKNFLEDEAEWVQETVREMARLNVPRNDSDPLTPDDPATPPSSPAGAHDDPDTHSSPTTADAAPADALPAQVKAVRKTPEPYIEPDDDPCVRFS